MASFNILYIGGNPEYTRLLSDNPDFFQCHKVENSLAAINFLNQRSDIDAILCDLYLPGMNALEIFKLFRNQQIHPKTPFIILSENSAPKQKEEAHKLRISDFYEGVINVESIYFRIDILKRYLNFFDNFQVVETPKREYTIPWNKRLFDIFVSLMALIALSPILVIVIIAIRLESKGKVYYTSKRVGTGYRIFDFYKLRSMRVGADSALQSLKHLNQYDNDGAGSEQNAFEQCPRCASLPEGEMCSQPLYREGEKICEYWYNEGKKRKGSATFIKIKDDPRVTKVGKFIRNTSIDELPQLLNVLKGDMSIVGNRPLPLYEAEMLTSDDWSERFMGPAGITGLWQVEKRGKKGAMSEEERKALDNQYARTYSFWGDIMLILRTIPAVFQKENV
jgi:lipopolysaccharide/colanic/teichoic acid biosynthesis glycosyltransferase/CheY-like chemotaxis protein